MIEEFLGGMSKTLSRIQLYPINHPLVTESIETSFKHLEEFLSTKNELVIAWMEDKLLVDGVPFAGLGMLAGTIGGLFEKYQLHSLTFQKGISIEELVSLYKLLTVRRDTIKNADEFKSFLAKENIRHIQVDVAIFAQVTGQQDGKTEGAAGTGSSVISEGVEGEKSVVETLIQKIEEMPLETMLWEIIQQAIPDANDQKKIYEVIFKQLKNELSEHVEKATQELKQEKEIIVSEQKRTESVVNSVAGGTVVVDEAGKIIMLNPAAEKMYGATLSELKGKKIEEISREELMVALSKEIFTLSGQDAAKEVNLKSTKNTQQIVKNSTAMIQNPEGKIVGIISILQDIAELRELQRMQNDFISHVTHELRSPLTAIKAALGSLTDETGSTLNPQQNQILTIADRNIDRLARLINDLLDFGKIEAGKIKMDLKPTDPRILLEEVVQSLQSWAHSKHLSIQLTFSEKISPIMADRDRVTQVLINLISNALKFTPANGKITVHAQTMGAQYLKISVTDTGPGISKKEQEHIFEKFYQLKQIEKTDTPGTGLGLHIAKTIVELHRGQIGLESQEGKGSTFFFTLPTAQERRIPTEEIVQKKKSWFARLFGR